MATDKCLKSVLLLTYLLLTYLLLTYLLLTYLLYKVFNVTIIITAYFQPSKFNSHTEDVISFINAQ